MHVSPDKKRPTRITCSPHITPFLRDEVCSLGFDIQDQDHVSVSVGAAFADCMRLNLELRTALHVNWLLKRFRCPSSKALYRHVASFPWEEVIANDSYVRVSSRVDHPSINNSMYPSLVTKDAICDRILKETGARPDSGPKQDHAVVDVDWKGDRAWIALNTTGRRLADRGYRRIPMKAPMQETLAAAVLLACGYDGTRPLVNPMCGSGTIAIEAALMAAGRAPGLLRPNFSFMHTLLFDDDVWGGIRAEVRKRPTQDSQSPIVASDIDPRAVEAARRNAMTAGVDHMIEFRTCDFADTPCPGEGGLVLVNPEYGERLGDREALGGDYKRLGDFFKARCAGRTCCVLTGSRELAGKIGLRAGGRTPFMNGRIECRLLRYEMYEGSREDPASTGR